MIILQKKDLYENVCRHHSAWDALREAEAGGNLQPSDLYDGCSETLKSHSSKHSAFSNS